MKFLKVSLIVLLAIAFVVGSTGCKKAEDASSCREAESRLCLCWTTQ